LLVIKFSPTPKRIFFQAAMFTVAGDNPLTVRKRCKLDAKGERGSVIKGLRHRLVRRYEGNIA
jgi:hypothetical protein